MLLWPCSKLHKGQRNIPSSICPHGQWAGDHHTQVLPIPWVWSASGLCYRYRSCLPKGVLNTHQLISYGPKGIFQHLQQVWLIATAVLVFFSAFCLEEKEQKNEPYSFSTSSGTAPTLMNPFFVLHFSGLPLTWHKSMEKPFPKSLWVFQVPSSCLVLSEAFPQPLETILRVLLSTSQEYAFHGSSAHMQPNLFPQGLL